MNNSRRTLWVYFLPALLLLLAVSGCGQMASESNFTLGAGDTVPGTLWVLSQNATLAKGSSVDGSVVMLCCNLIVEGAVTGNVLLLTGNVMIGSHAEVGGEVSILSGNLSQE